LVCVAVWRRNTQFPVLMVWWLCMQLAMFHFIYSKQRQSLTLNIIFIQKCNVEKCNGHE
jgi:hypothetical protein